MLGGLQDSCRREPCKLQRSVSHGNRDCKVVSILISKTLWFNFCIKYINNFSSVPDLLHLSASAASTDTTQLFGSTVFF